MNTMISQTIPPSQSPQRGIPSGKDAFRRVPAFARFRRIATTLLLLFLAIPAFAQTPPTITRQPVSASRSLGDRVTLLVSAFGDEPMNFQWRFNGSPILNATNKILVLTNLNLANAGTYSLVMTNAVGRLTSEPATLEIDPTFTAKLDSAVAQQSGQGVSWVDYDGDGCLDLYVAGETRHLLFHNNCDGAFKLIESPALQAVILRDRDLLGGFWADYDNDGRPDLFAAVSGNIFNQTPKQNHLFHNEGNGRFTRVTRVAPASVAAITFQGLWGDYNQDGSLDLFLLNSARDFDRNQASGNFLYLGDGLGNFTQWTHGTALTEWKRSFSSGTTGDVNGDGRLDLAVTAFGAAGSAFTVENLPGTELEQFSLGGLGIWAAGCSLADYDNDGDLDLFVGFENQPSILFRNDGLGNFTEDANAGLAQQALGGMTGAWADYDNDGWLDLLVTSFLVAAYDGTAIPQNENANDFLYHNNGDGTFSRVTTGSLVNDGVASFSAAWGDFDNDGFLDLAVGRCAAGYNTRNTTGVKCALFRNNGNQNSWLKLKLVGTKSNRDAIGAKIFVKASINGKAVRQLREINAGHGWASQNDLRPHFGLGDATLADEVRVEWPSGQVTELKNVPAKQFLTLTEPGGPPHLQATRMDGNIQITLRGDAGQSYTIEVSNDLLSWTKLGVVTGAAVPVPINDATSSELPTRYYRAVAR